MTCWLISETCLDEQWQVVRSTVVQAEVAGFLKSGPSAFLVVCCGRPFPVGTAVRFRWEGESGAARVEDCFGHDSQYVLWLEMEASSALVKRSGYLQ